MKIPNRKERRKASKRKKIKKHPRSFQTIIENMQENIEVGHEIHKENLKEQEIKNQTNIANKQKKEYDKLMQMYKDSKTVNMIFRKKYEKNNG